ncbi:hypothetical protein [Phyllobacterium sp. 22552]|uniref:hypothetical protein n=1 Tax=Phyllobacterium sp. 22552 TaxID=3453941 RepID=UPI003F824649
MEAIEQAIRNALAKADAKNPAIRQKVYESAWGAHERSLAANGALDDAQREERRERLKLAITKIENEAQAARPVVNAAPAPVVEPREPSFSAAPAAPRGRDARIEPTIGNAPAPELGAPELATDRPFTAGNERPDYVKKDRYRREKKQRQESKKATGLTKLLIVLALFVVAIVVLWMVATGIINSKPSSVPASTGNPAASGSHEPLKEGQLPSEGTWIGIFEPSDTTQVSVSGRATATIDGDQVQKYLRIKSPSEADEISFQIGEGVLQQLAGKTALFDIVARTPDGTATQMAVSCNFGNLGECGRKRYDVSDASKEYLVQVDFPADKKPSGNGAIRINSDISQTGKVVDIIAIRVQITN